MTDSINLKEYNCSIVDFHNRTIKHKRPSECPYCGNKISSICIHSSNTIIENRILLTLVLKCPDPQCSKEFVCTYISENTKDDSYNLIFIYPSLSVKKFDDEIERISPKFVSQYNEAYQAEQLGHIDLASCGYRNALETLIKDYAIGCLNKSYGEVAKLKLFKAIEEYVPDLKGAADVVRIIGNDKTHYEQKYDIDFVQLKYYMDIFEYLLTAKLKMLNPPVSR